MQSDGPVLGPEQTLNSINQSIYHNGAISSCFLFLVRSLSLEAGLTGGAGAQSQINVAALVAHASDRAVRQPMFGFEPAPEI